MKGTWEGSGTWQSSGGGGGAGFIALMVALVVAGVIIHAIWHTVVEAAEIGAIAVASAAGLGLIVFIGWVVALACSDRPERPVVPARIVQPPPGLGELEDPYRPVVEPARQLHLHLNVSPDELAAIMRRYTEED